MNSTSSSEQMTQQEELLLNETTNTVNGSTFVFIIRPYIYLEHHFGLMVTSALVIGFAALIGSLGNILIILAICCVRTLRTCGNMFVLNLALADMIVTLLIDPFNVVGAVAGRNILLANYSLCNIIASFCGPACLSSMWNMCAISLNRYVFICKPHLYPKIFTFKSTILCCVGIWLLAHLLHMPNHIGWGHNRFSIDYYICTFDMYTHSYGIFYITTGVVVPLLGVLFGYTAIFLKVRSVKRLMLQHRRATAADRSCTAGPTTAFPPDIHESIRARRRLFQKHGFCREDVNLAKTLFAAFMVFLVSWFLVVVFVLAHVPKDVPGWLHVVAIVLAHGNSAANPILYGFTNEKFRNGYRTVLCLNRPGAVGHSSAPTRRTVPSSGCSSQPLTDRIMLNMTDRPSSITGLVSIIQ